MIKKYKNNTKIAHEIESNFLTLVGTPASKEQLKKVATFGDWYKVTDVEKEFCARYLAEITDSEGRVDPDLERDRGAKNHAMNDTRLRNSIAPKVCIYALIHSISNHREDMKGVVVAKQGEGGAYLYPGDTGYDKASYVVSSADLRTIIRAVDLDGANALASAVSVRRAITIDEQKRLFSVKGEWSSDRQPASASEHIKKMLTVDKDRLSNVNMTKIVFVNNADASYGLLGGKGLTGGGGEGLMASSFLDPDKITDSDVYKFLGGCGSAPDRKIDKSDKPKAETPNPDKPMVEAPKPDEPMVEAPKPDEPKPDEPKPQAKTTIYQFSLDEKEAKAQMLGDNLFSTDDESLGFENLELRFNTLNSKKYIKSILSDANIIPLKSVWYELKPPKGKVCASNTHLAINAVWYNGVEAIDKDYMNYKDWSSRVIAAWSDGGIKGRLEAARKALRGCDAGSGRSGGDKKDCSEQQKALDDLLRSDEALEYRKLFREAGDRGLVYGCFVSEEAEGVK